MFPVATTSCVYAGHPVTTLTTAYWDLDSSLCTTTPSAMFIQSTSTIPVSIVNSASTTATSTVIFSVDLYYTVILLIVIAIVGVLTFIRSLFSSDMR